MKKVTQYFLFNPELPKGIIKKEDFWLYKNYFAHTQEKNFVNEITYYLDNLKNVTSERITLHENLKKTNPSKYLPYCLGEWGQYSNEIPFFFGINKQKILRKIVKI